MATAACGAGEGDGCAPPACDQASPTQAIILAAGRGSRLKPYTDAAPTALISISERPIIAHSIDALRRQGVTRFVVCRGWQGSAFDDELAGLGEGVVLVDCPLFASTGMLESLRTALEQLSPGGFYLLYGDIVFRPSVARQLREAHGGICVVVNAAAPGILSKGLAEVEVVTTVGQGPTRAVRRIGKGRCANEHKIEGEFAGLVKFSSAGWALAGEALGRIRPENGSCTSSDLAEAAPARKRIKHGNGLPWWLEPMEKASLSDLLQLLADEGVGISTATIFGGWHEVNTPQDLTRARNDTPMFLSEEDAVAQVAAMGACLLSEANDLKRPLTVVAQELNMDLAKLECLLQGNLEVSDALGVLRKMSEVYPVPLNDLWLDADDTTDGVRLCSADASEASARVLNRPDRTGGRTPYYEYRDAAMSRRSQFRPEWIRELRVVKSGDPMDPDVVLNNGHLMMQATFFVGPVDFYYKDQHGVVHRKEMNTGDSNFISPFVPHSFTARDPDVECIIIAVTYGGAVRRAFTEFSRVGARNVFALSGDGRDPALTRRCVLQRHLRAECLTVEGLARLVGDKIPADRVAQLAEGTEATHEELGALAGALHVRPSDLTVCGLEEHEEVVVARAQESQSQARCLSTYQMAPLARTRHQPDLKTFDLEVRDNARPGEALSCGLHTFVYAFGSEPAELSWEGKGHRRTAVLHPGDSAYIAPLVEHRFSVCESPAPAERRANPNGKAHGVGRRFFVVRIPGHLTGETLAEFSTFSATGRERVGAETQQWYN